jgi:hypothetical protein
MADQKIVKAEGARMKRLLWPILILALLAAILIFVQNQRDKSKAPERTTNFLDLNANKVDRLDIERLGSKVELKRIDGLWHVMIDSVPKPADTAMVAGLVEMATNIEVGGVESSNPAKQSIYQVDTMLGTRVTLFAGERELAGMIIGKNAQGYDYSYVRKLDSDDVYRARGLMAYQFNKPPQNWRERTIANIDTAGLHTIEFHYRDEKFSLERTDTVWYVIGDKISGSQTALADSVELFKRLLVNLKTDDFYQDIDSAFVQTDNPMLELVLKHTNGDAERLLVYGASENENRYYLRTEDSREVFVLYESKYSQLTRRLNNFVAFEKNG